MSVDRKLIRLSLFVLFASTALCVVKFVAYYHTGSTAILSDAFESIVNVVAALVGVFVMKAVAEPADEEHPYGHGKLEYFSAAFEGGLITLAGIMIVIESLSAIWRGSIPEDLGLGMWLTGATAVCNLFLGYYLKYQATKTKSEAISASAHHLLSDVWTTLGVLIGLLLMKLTNLFWIDQVVSISMALFLLISGLKIVRKSAGGLIDEKEEESLQLFAEAIKKSHDPGMIDVHQFRVIRAGRFHHVDAHLVVPEFWDIAYTHERIAEFERTVVSHYPLEGEINFHLDPCKRLYCKQCELSDCQVRQASFEAIHPVTAESISKGPRYV